MFRSKSPVIILATLLLSSPLRLSAQQNCTVKVCSTDTEIGCFRGIAKVDDEKELSGKDLLRFMRSNPSGSLECFRQQAAAGSSEMQCLGAFSGVIGGDVKPDNVDIEETKGEEQIRLIDLDDGGWGSLLGDVFHTLTYNQVWERRLSFDEATSAYLAGLKDEELIGVSSLQEILGKPDSPDRSCGTVKQKWDHDKKIKLVEHGSQCVQKLYADDRATFEEEIRKVGKSKHGSGHEGFEMKTEDGGSMCMPRFVYLVSDKHQKWCDVVQFKLQRPPAAAVFSDGQTDHEKRLASLVKYYREGAIGNHVDKEPVRGNGSNKYFIARYDREPRFDEEKANDSDWDAYAKHMLHWLGRVHATQNTVYAKHFTKEFPAIRDELKRMIHSHIKYLKEQAGKLEPYKCGQ